MSHKETIKIPIAQNSISNQINSESFQHNVGDPDAQRQAEVISLAEHRVRKNLQVEGLEQVETLMLRLSQNQDLGSKDKAKEMIHEHLSSGGKRLRARLALSAISALGGDPKQSIGWGAAVELLHNATLIHDDIQDGDTLRRGSPTTWVRHGQAQAINAGDLLLMLPFLALSHVQTSDEIRWRLSWVLAQHASDIVRGQVEELDMVGGKNIDEKAYFKAVAGKTGGLFSLPLEGAALLAGLSNVQASELGRAVLPLGVIFQIQDDILDLFGNKGRERPGTDLKEGKVSIFVVRHVQRCPEDRDLLLNLLKKPRELCTDQEIAHMIKRFDEAGTLEDVLNELWHKIALLRNEQTLLLFPHLHRCILDMTDLVTRPIAHLRKD